MNPDPTTLTVCLSGQETNLSVFERRAGPDLVLFVHGLGAAKECFADAWCCAELDGLSLLAPDLPGHGASPKPRGFGGSMEDLASVLAAVLDSRHFERLHVVTHSMGGAPALLLAQDATLALASFTNVEGNLIAEDCGILSRRTAAMSLESFREEKFTKLVAAAKRSNDPTTRRWAGWAARCDPCAFHQACVSVVGWSDSEQLLEIFLGLGAATLYVCGERSAVPAVLGRLQRLPTVEVPDTGHDVMNERPEVFYPLLARHVIPQTRSPARAPDMEDAG